MLVFCRTSATSQRQHCSSITRFGGNGSEDECTFIITNTFIVTLFEASRTQNEFYIEFHAIKLTIAKENKKIVLTYDVCICLYVNEEFAETT